MLHALHRPIFVCLLLAGCAGGDLPSFGGDAAGGQDAGRADGEDTRPPDPAPRDVGGGDGPLRVRIVSPSDRSLAGGWLEVAAEALSPHTLLGVEFHVDGKRVDTDLVAPFEARIDSTGWPDGPVTIEAVAADSGGHSARSAVEVTVDNSPPDVRFASPVPDLPVYFDGAGVQLELEVGDASGLASLDVRVNGVPVEVEGGPDYRARLDLEALMLSAADLPFELVVQARAVDRRFQETTVVGRFPVLPRLEWSYQTRGEIWTRPAVDRSGGLYVGSQDGQLYALEASGAERWSYDAGAPVMTDAALGTDGALYFAAGRHVISLDSAGRELWRTNAGGQVGSSPALSPNGRWLYMGTYDRSVLGLKTSDGSVLWTFETNGDVLSSPAVSADGIIYVGCHDHNVYALGPEGFAEWEWQASDEVWGSPLVTSTGRVFVGANDEYVYSLTGFGTKVWEAHVRGGVWGRPAEGPDGTLYVASTSRRLYALAPDGEERWQAATGGIASSSPIVDAAGTVYVGSTDGRLYAIGADGSVRWTFETDGQILGTPVLSPDQMRVYVGSTDRRVYALRTGMEGQPACPAPEMVAVGDYEIMAYEASRLDARGDSEGRMNDGVCSRPNVRPWVHVDWSEAQAACRTAGMKLCSVAQWEHACRGPDGADLPYGDAPKDWVCNGADNEQTGCSSGGCRPVPGGSLEGCAGPAGTWDMSGNVAEWTAEESQLFEGNYVVRGGSFRTPGDALRCAFDELDATHLPAEARRDDLGFRCCRPR